ncbi:hypothetical protein [Streptomyces sp. URMC 123]|uniref:hypothetical protein n=1 Tax=Streptomyces sp. URMC 123 TaxID=3423403 RepID=UPI003F1E3C9B
MADTAAGPGPRSRGREAVAAAPVLAGRPSGTRHPLVAVAMVLPIAVLLAVVFGGWEAVVTHASSVVGTLGR